MDPLKPKPSILIKLGSIVVHAEELVSPQGHQLDLSAIQGLLNDGEVQDWIKAMNKMALLPVKRES